MHEHIQTQTSLGRRIIANTIVLWLKLVYPSSNFCVYIYIYIYMMDKRSPNTYTFIINNDTYTSVVTDVIFIYLYIIVYIFHNGTYQPNFIKTQFVPHIEHHILALGRTTGKYSNWSIRCSLWGKNWICLYNDSQWPKPLYLAHKHKKKSPYNRLLRAKGY